LARRPAYAGPAVDEIVLAAVRFVGDDDDIPALAQAGHPLSPLGQKFLDCGEDHSSARHGQQFAHLLRFAACTGVWPRMS
jgi:hypothetical protein